MNDVEALDTYVMNLEGNEEEIFMDIKKKTRYEIRKAEKECEVFVSNDSKYIDDFYKIELDTVKRNNWTAYSKDYIKKRI
ncbi:MAG: peptidoglycan bridge formation glycyltransferase FemA/FemB family protein [Candidatus Dojkabacteria bacterium]|nr:peptidoglycan bridge formation glycyltransferase FemA/FemB family protein [Candidatus Dojkabacteria bacterium]